MAIQEIIKMVYMITNQLLPAKNPAFLGVNSVINIFPVAECR